MPHSTQASTVSQKVESFSPSSSQPHKSLQNSIQGPSDFSLQSSRFLSNSTILTLIVSTLLAGRILNPCDFRPALAFAADHELFDRGLCRGRVWLAGHCDLRLDRCQSWCRYWDKVQYCVWGFLTFLFVLSVTGVRGWMRKFTILIYLHVAVVFDIFCSFVAFALVSLGVCVGPSLG